MPKDQNMQTQYCVTGLQLNTFLIKFFVVYIMKCFNRQNKFTRRNTIPKQIQPFLNYETNDFVKGIKKQIWA